MSSYLDQTGSYITVSSSPRRIISLVPSITELLSDLNLNDEVVGITKFCIKPENWYRHKTRIGGTKNLNIELIRQLQPDLIIANKEENLKEQVETLQKEFPVWISDVSNFKDAMDMINSIGQLTNRENESSQLITSIRGEFEKLHAPKHRLKAAYLIWQNPYMTVGGDTFISDMLHKAGFENVFAFQDRYPTITPADIESSHCEILMLSSEPFPFNSNHQSLLQNEFPHTKLILVDGEMFSWYGSRLRYAPAYFSGLGASLNMT